MSKIIKFNEFVNNDDISIEQLIKEAECTNKPDLESIANREPYKRVIALGKKVIPYLLERLDHSGPVWDRALTELVGEGLDPLEYTTSERINFWKNWAKNNDF
jgi:hypothetical protein